jgi:hypothetical protein
MSGILRDAVFGLYGAARLVCFQRDGAQWLNESLDSARRSFVAMLLVVPAYLLIRLLGVFGPAPDVSLELYLTIQTIAFAGKLAGYFLAVHAILVWLGHPERLARYISGSNWISLLTITPVLIMTLITATGAVDPGDANGVLGIVLVWNLLVNWFIARELLGLAAPAALLIVVLEVTINVVTDNVVLNLLGIG